MKQQTQINKIEWKEVELREILEFHKSGCWGEESKENEGVSVLRSTNFSKNLELKIEKIAYRKISQKDLSEKKLEFGDLLLEKSGGGPGQPVGRVIFFNLKDGKNYVCGNFIEILRLDKNKIYPKFVYYFLKKFYLSGRTNQMFNKTTGIQNIKLREYLSIKISIPFSNGKPDLKEQERIVLILEKSEKIKEWGEKAEKLLDEYLKSVFNEMFGDPFKNKNNFVIKPLKEIADFINGRAFKPSEWSNEGLKIIRIQNLNNPHAKFNYFSGRIEEKNLVNTGDLLFSWSGTPGTSFGVFIWKGERAVLNQHIFNVKMREKVDKIYFQYFLNSKLSELISRSHGGVGLQHITKSEVDKVKFTLPPFHIQQKFTKIVEQVEKMKDNVNKTNKISEELFDSLMSKTFRGEL